MITENAIYKLIADIISKYDNDGVKITGTYVFPYYGSELNNSTLSQNFYDALGGLTTDKKYPLAFILPLKTMEKDLDNGAQELEVSVGFITTNKQLGGSLKNPNVQVGISNSLPQDDWEDMEIAARSTINALSFVFDDQLHHQYLASNMYFDTNKKPRTRRISFKNNDNVNGVIITFVIVCYRGFTYNSTSIEGYTKNDLYTVPMPNGLVT